MKFAILGVLAVLASLAGGGQAWPQSARTPLPVESFAAIPEETAFRISPDGTYIAFLRRKKSSRALVVAELVDGEILNPRELDLGDQGTINNVFWANTERLLVSVTKLLRVRSRSWKIPASMLLAFNRDGGDPRVVLQPNSAAHKARLSNDDLIALLPDEPRHVLVGDAQQRRDTSEVYKLDIYTGEKTLVLGPEENLRIFDWYADRSGTVRLGFGRDSRKKRVMLVRTSAEAPWRQLQNNEFFEDGRFRPLTFGEESETIYVASSHINGRSAVFRFNIETGELAGKVFEHDEVDIENIFFRTASGNVAAFTYTLDRPELFILDEGYRRLQESIDAALPSTVNRIVSSSPDGEHMVVWATSATEPGTFYMYEPGNRRMTGFAWHYPDLPREGLAPMERVTVSARDSLEIPAYLTLPKDAGEGLLPAVVLPHGGPASRDSIGFSWLVQFLADRGYAVIQPNFRGSSGYGSRFEALGYGGWGRAMQDDVTDATRWLVENGIADPARICIVGWSYGGYAALMGSIRQPELYRCAAAIAPVTDVKKLLADVKSYDVGDWDYIKIAGSLSKKEIDRISPVRRYKEMTLPLLLVHGDEDRNVDVEHSRKFEKAMRKTATPVRYVEFEEGDHSLLDEAHRVRLLTELESFLAEHLDAGASVGAPTRTAGTGD